MRGNTVKPLDNFFYCDPMTHDITSFSIGELWMYFYKEILVAVTHLSDSSYSVILDIPENGFDHDGFSARGELTSQVLSELHSELLLRGVTARGTREDLQEIALKGASKEISEVIHQVIIGGT